MGSFLLQADGESFEQFVDREGHDDEEASQGGEGVGGGGGRSAGRRRCAARRHGDHVAVVVGRRHELGEGARVSLRRRVLMVHLVAPRCRLRTFCSHLFFFHSYNAFEVYCFSNKKNETPIFFFIRRLISTEHEARGTTHVLGVGRGQEKYLLGKWMECEGMGNGQE